MVGSNTVESILKAMQDTLNAHQLKRLKGVLSANLAVEVSPASDDENANLLDSFLAAKELEGCSERTLKYYESTLAHYIQNVLLQCLFDRFGSVFPQCGLMVFPGVVIVSR